MIIISDVHKAVAKGDIFIVFLIKIVILIQELQNFHQHDKPIITLIFLFDGHWSRLGKIGLESLKIGFEVFSEEELEALDGFGGGEEVE